MALLGEQRVQLADNFVRVRGEGGPDVPGERARGAGDRDVWVGGVEHYLGEGDVAALLGVGRRWADEVAARGRESGEWGGNMVDFDSASYVKEGPIHCVPLITFRPRASKERRRYRGTLERGRWWSVHDSSHFSIFISASSLPAYHHRDN